MGSKQRYYNLFNAVADVAEHLIKAERQAENMYIESNDDSSSTYDRMYEYLMGQVQIAFDHLDRIETEM